MSKINVHVVFGPTGSGKTKLALELAKNLNGQLISCDSRQVYTQLNVGTNKESSEQLNGVVIHLQNILDLNQTINAGEFAAKAKQAIIAINSEGYAPILVGGTGLYILATLSESFGTETTRSSILESLNLVQLQAKYLELYKVNSLNNSDFANKVRLLKQIANYESGKMPQKLQLDSNYSVTLHLTNKPLNYVQVLQLRLDGIFEAWVNEVNELLKTYSENAPGFNTMGYKQIIDYIQGKSNKDETFKRIVNLQVKYGKRQETYSNQLLKLLNS